MLDVGVARLFQTRRMSRRLREQRLHFGELPERNRGVIQGLIEGMIRTFWFGAERNVQLIEAQPGGAPDGGARVLVLLRCGRCRSSGW